MTGENPKSKARIKAVTSYSETNAINSSAQKNFK